MKIIAFKTSLVLLAAGILQAKLYAEGDTNATYLKIVNASNNVAVIEKSLPDVDALWPQHPDAYLKSVNQAARVLDGALSNSNTKKKFYDLFANVMQKSCPTNEEQAASWVKLKRNIIYFYAVHDEVKNDKAQWLAVAKFLGEIRAKEIPNYKNQAMNISEVTNDPQEQAKLKNEIEENKRKQITDNLQSELWQTDSTIMFLLQHVCPFTQSNESTDTNFINQVVTDAHLTSGEKKQLFSK